MSSNLKTYSDSFPADKTIPSQTDNHSASSPSATHSLSAMAQPAYSYSPAEYLRDEGFDQEPYTQQTFHRNTPPHLQPPRPSENTDHSTPSPSLSDRDDFAFNFNHMNDALPSSSHPGTTRASTPSEGSESVGSIGRLSSNPGTPYSGDSDHSTPSYPQPRARTRPGRSGGSPSMASVGNPYSTLARQSIYSSATASGSRSSLFGIGGVNSGLTSRTLTTNGKNAIHMYREAAKKTNDEGIQLAYAKFLLQSADSTFGDFDPSNINATYSVYMPGDSLSSTPEGSTVSLPLNHTGNSSNSPTDEESKEALIKEGIYWIKHLQRKGNPEASFIAGTWFEQGKYGISRDESKATQLFSYAAKNHHAEAPWKVGQYFEKKKSNGRAYSYYNMGAALGDPCANYRMAMIYLNGELGRKVDIKKAMIFLRRAAEIADERCPEACYTLGIIYLGIFPNPDVYEIVFKDTEEAHRLLDKAANMGSVEAQYKLGSLFEFAAFNFPADPFASVTYYRMAAEKGHPEAQMALSGWYLSGSEGVLEQSDKEAFEWCFAAAKQGLPRAEFGMGYYFEVGIGTVKDPNVARDWYELAAKHGSEEAKKRLEEDIIGQTQENSAALRRRVTQKRVSASKRSSKKAAKNGGEKESCSFM